MRNKAKKIRSILLVDDDEITNIYNKLVIQKNYSVNEIIEAKNGLEAITFIKKLQQEERGSLPDIIFLDLNMPILNGWDFIEEYTSLKVKRSKIFILTSSPNPDDEDRARKYSVVSGYYTKPLTNTYLNQILSYN
jgi:CheY-like chemotaxis protein